MNASEARAQALQTAIIIKQQIGVWPFAEISARDFIASPDRLTFTCKPSTRLYRVTVRLNGLDLYDVHAMKITSPYTSVDVAENIDFTQLPEIIRSLSGRL